MPMLTINSTELYYDDVGHGPAVVLIHGWGTSTRVWNAQFTDLAVDHRVVALDCRGCGRSGRPATGNTIDGNADDVMGLCRALELDRPVLVGSSIGATFALAAAHRYPESVGGVVTIDGPGFWPAQGMAEPLVAMQRSLCADRAAALEGWVPNWFGPKVGDGVRAWTIRQILDSGAHIDVLFTEHRTFDPRPLLAATDVPMLFVHGKLDAEIPIVVAQESAAAAGAPLIVIDDSGHMPHIESPLGVNAALREFVGQTTEARNAVR